MWKPNWHSLAKRTRLRRTIWLRIPTCGYARHFHIKICLFNITQYTFSERKKCPSKLKGFYLSQTQNSFNFYKSTGCWAIKLFLLYTSVQGWQKPRFYEYCPAQWEILGKPGFYWVLLGNTGQYWVIQDTGLNFKEDSVIKHKYNTFKII